MWGYIDEQKVILENILSLQRDTFSTLSKTFISPKEIIITASGTSLNAAMLVKCLIEKEADCSIIVENPFQLRYYSKHLYNPQNILIVISQTGKSTGTLECLQIAKQHHIPTVSITANGDSPIAKKANIHIDMLCGEENVGPKIKGYSATVLTLHLLLLKITQNPRYQSITQEYYQSIQELPQNIKASLCWCQKNKHWALAKAMSIVGFGVNYPTAREGTLKILETMQIPVMNFDMEEFMHGPHRTIIKDSYIVLIDTDGCGKILMNNFIDFIKTKTSNYLIISTLKTSNENIIHINQHSYTSSWLNAVIPFQIMCTNLPECHGINSSDPVYGDFATTVGTRIE